MHPQVKEELPPDCPREAQAMQQSLEEIQARAKNSEAAAVARAEIQLQEADLERQFCEARKEVEEEAAETQTRHKALQKLLSERQAKVFDYEQYKDKLRVEILALRRKVKQEEQQEDKEQLEKLLGLEKELLTKLDAHQQRLTRDKSKEEQLVQRQQQLEALKKRQAEKYHSSQQKLLHQFHLQTENKQPQTAKQSPALLRSAKPSLQAQLDEQLRVAAEKRCAAKPPTPLDQQKQATDQKAMQYLLQLQEKHAEQKQEQEQQLHSQQEEAKALHQRMLEAEQAAAAAAAVAQKQKALREEALQQEELAQQREAQLAQEQQQAEESKQAQLELEASELRAFQNEAREETEKRWQEEAQDREAMLEQQAYNRKCLEEHWLQQKAWATPSTEQHEQWEDTWQQEAQQADLLWQQHEHQQPWQYYTWGEPVPTTTHRQEEEVEALQQHLEQQKLEEKKQREEVVLLEEKVAQQRQAMLEAEQQLSELQQASKKPRLETAKLLPSTSKAGPTPKFLAPTSKAVPGAPVVVPPPAKHPQPKTPAVVPPPSMPFPVGRVESGFWLKEPVQPGLLSPGSVVPPKASAEAPATPMATPATPVATPATPTAGPGSVEEPMEVEALPTTPATLVETPAEEKEKLVPTQPASGTVTEPGYLGSYFMSRFFFVWKIEMKYLQQHPKTFQQTPPVGMSLSACTLVSVFNLRTFQIECGKFANIQRHFSQKLIGG